MSQSLSQTIAQKISLQDKHTRVIVAAGPCRSGTTAFLRVFSEAGIESWYQPIKKIIRDGTRQIDYTFQIPAAPTILIKETLGGFTTAEAFYNPLDILIEAGVAKENIHLISITREPLSTACSWVQTIGPLFSNSVAVVDRLALGYQMTLQLVAYAQEHNIKHTPYVYELLRDNDPEVVRLKLLDEAGVPSPQTRTNWSDLPPIETTTKLSKHFDQGQHYYVTDLHGRLDRSDGLTYYNKSLRELTQYLDDNHLSVLINKGAFDDYQTHKKMCAAHFGLPIKDIGIPVELTQQLTTVKIR